MCFWDHWLDTPLVKTSICCLCFLFFEYYDVKFQCNNQVLEQENRWPGIVNATTLNNIASVSVYKFKNKLTLLLHRSRPTMKQFTLTLSFFFSERLLMFLYFSSEYIAWLTVIMTESVAIVTLNILTLSNFVIG